MTPEESLLPCVAPSSLKESPHHEGHRQRLRERFLQGSSTSLPDYELLELLLFLAQPRRDTKPLAKALLKTFGSLGAIVNASPQRLFKQKGIGHSCIVLLKAFQESMRRILKEELEHSPLLNNSEKVVQYCRICMAHLEIEQFRMLFLNHKNMLITDEVLQEGTVDQTPLYPREVIKRALELSASNLIMIHNHPSGDPSPSAADLQVTKKLERTAQALEIHVLDHIIIGKWGYFSFREQALL